MEIGEVEIGEVEIGEEEQAQAVRAVLEKARDNRRPAPPLRAVDVDAPAEEDAVTAWLGTVFIGQAEATEQNQFPLTTKYLLAYGGGGGDPRVVRVDTEESYRRFRASQSPEMAALQQRVSDLEAALADHANDPEAHEALEEALDETMVVGAEVAQAEADKKVDVWLPPWAKGKVRTWQQDGFICVSMRLPGSDGRARICTAVEPAQRGVDEMERHASEADVEPTAIVGCIEEMGHVLGAANIIKDIAVGAPAILNRPEADRAQSFVVRLEPKASPAVMALLSVLSDCRRGDAPACDEWKRMAQAARAGGATAVAQAMREAQQLLVSADKGR